MIGPQRLLGSRKGAEEEGLGLGVGTLAVAQSREVVEAFGGIGVIGPQVLFRPGKLFFLNPDRFQILALLLEGLNLPLPLLNLRRIGAAALPPGLGNQIRPIRDFRFRPDCRHRQSRQACDYQQAGAETRG